MRNRQKAHQLVSSNYKLILRIKQAFEKKPQMKEALEAELKFDETFERFE